MSAFEILTNFHCLGFYQECPTGSKLGMARVRLDSRADPRSSACMRAISLHSLSHHHEHILLTLAQWLITDDIPY